MALPTRARSARLVVVALVSVSLLTITVDYREGDSGPLASLGRTALTVISPLAQLVDPEHRWHWRRMEPPRKP